MDDSFTLAARPAAGTAGPVEIPVRRSRRPETGGERPDTTLPTRTEAS
ncbi:hypothetical protein FHS43_004338 [Streptosporangium becharense]|uniref:Uncharacterized protein n=1 Tax=Streptosporangium becharense TaxID=1816182 RepID=A0A7W9ICE9_9ACTN|nr:hypothetical protein [Streptosporangium becharense]MBB5818132.1 hypothetical protein [Streptosporangium becharense]